MVSSVKRTLTNARLRLESNVFKYQHRNDHSMSAVTNGRLHIIPSHMELQIRFAYDTFSQNVKGLTVFVIRDGLVAGKSITNPCKLSVLFVGHVQTQIRRSRTLRLIRVSTVCLDNFLSKFEYTLKIPPNNP